MKSRFTRTNLKIFRVSSNAWRGTLAAQTNEQCLSNMQDTLGAESSSDKEFRVKVLTRSSLLELLPGPSLWSASQHPTQDSRFNTIQTKAPCVCLRCPAVSLARHHVSVCAAQLSHWQGTVAAQTNEQLRERILFEKPGLSVTNLFSSLQDKKWQPAQTITNYPKSYSTKFGHDRSTNTNTAKIRRKNPKPKPSETLKPCNDCQSWGVGKLLEHLRVWLDLLETEFEDTLAKKKVAYMSDLRTLLGQADMIRVQK